MEDHPNFYLMFGRLEGKVDALLTNQSRTDARLEDVEKRVGDIENAKAQGLGMFRMVHFIWMLLAATAGLFADQIKALFIR